MRNIFENVPIISTKLQLISHSSLGGEVKNEIRIT